MLDICVLGETTLFGLTQVHCDSYKEAEQVANRMKKVHHNVRISVIRPSSSTDFVPSFFRYKGRVLWRDVFELKIN